MGTHHRQQVTITATHHSNLSPCVYCQNLCFCIVETQYDEGPRDWQKLFTMRRFCYTEFLFHITRIKKIVCYTEDFVIYTVEV